MPGKMSVYLQNALLQHILGQAVMTFPAPANLYVGLCTAFDEAQDGGSWTEVSGNGYVRQGVVFSAPSGLATNNTATLAFPKATGDWGTPTYWIVTDAATGGHALFWGPITNALSILSGEVLEIDPANLSISLSGSASTPLSNLMLNAVLRGQPWTLSAITHVALLASYTNDTTFSEVADAAYARQPINWNAVVGGTSANAARLQYPTAAASYSASHVGLFTALTGGNLLFAQPLAALVTVGAGKNFRFNPGDLTLGLD